MNHKLGDVDLNVNMIWADEFDWQPVEASLEYSITGNPIIDAGEKQAGRPITLQAADDSGWISRAAVRAVQAMSETAGATFPLLLADGRLFNVMFRPGEVPISAKPVGRPALPGESWCYVTQINLIEV